MYHPTRQTGADAVTVARARELRRAMTPAERVMWQALRALRPHGYTFRRQQVIAGFIVDFYCHRARLVIEVDGEIHALQVDYDAERDAVIAAHALRILRIANDDVLDHRDTVLSQITALCQTPAPEGLLTSPLPLAPQGEGVGG